VVVEVFLLITAIFEASRRICCTVHHFSSGMPRGAPFTFAICTWLMSRNVVLNADSLSY